MTLAQLRSVLADRPGTANSFFLENCRVSKLRLRFGNLIFDSLSTH
jgi:hypothetical protein